MESSNTDPLVNTLAILLREILDGANPKAGWLLNPGDAGLLASLSRLSAQEASVTSENGAASIAAHVEHLRYGLELLNRWTQGEDPYPAADWTIAWKRLSVTPDEWTLLCAGLRREAGQWQNNFPQFMKRGKDERTAAVASAAHLAYHFGAIRQLDRAIRGPSAEEGQ